MTAIEVKILLLRKGLTFAGMAKELHEADGPGIRSLEVMIADLMYGRRWYPTLAAKIKRRFGITIKRSAHLEPIRQQLRRAA